MSTETIDPRIKKFKKIISIDPYSQKNYEYRDQTLKATDKLSLDNKNFVISFVRNKDMIIASFDVGYGVDEEELDDMLYMKAYDELGLDPEKEYIISHQKADEDNSSGVYNLFITEPDVVDENLASTLEKTTYIDLLIPAPLLYKTLYNSETLDKNESHCYIYFTMDDAFITIYKDGEFLYSKSLEYSLTQIYEKYCAIIGEKVDEKGFFETLESEGLKAIDSEYQQNLVRLFSEIFLQINDIIIYTKRAYGIDTIQKLFLGSIKSPIIGLGDYGYNYLGIPTFNLDFNFHIKNDEWYVDQFQYMMVQSGLDYIKNPLQVLNLTTVPRPPVFSKRASGQFIISATISSLVALSIPLFFLVQSYLINAHILQLSSQSEALYKITDRYKRILKEKRELITINKKELSGLKTIFDGKAKTLTSIYNKKVDYRLKSSLLNRFAHDLLEYKVKLEKINSNKDSFILYVVSDDDKKITKYIKYISKKYFNDIKNINIERISIDEDDLLYRGVLKVSYI
jgi:hypothetical protein